MISWFRSFKIDRKKQILTISTLAPMAIILVVWAIMGMFPFGNKSQMAVDFSQQYIGLYGFMKHTLLTGDWSGLFYSFSKSLGGSMIGIWAYYLISPFNIFYLILPLSKFVWAVFISILLRYGAMGFTFAFLLIKRYRAMEYNPWLVPLMSTAYTLSGMIVSYQMNPIFYDAFIMLPLVVWALEEMIDGKKPLRYVLLLALMVFFQFYMGYMACIFIALYTLYYAAPRLAIVGDWKIKLSHYLKAVVPVILYSLLGVASVCFILYPVFLNLLTSKGAYETPWTWAWAFQINPLDILAKLMIGGFDNTSGWSAGPNLPNIYIGSFALIGFLFYFKYAKAHLAQKWAVALISTFFFFSMTHEATSKIWHMGQNPAGFFYRFTWIVCFFFVLLAYQTLREEIRISVRDLAIGAFVALISVLYVNSQDYTFISLNQPEALTAFVTGQKTLVLVLLIAIFGGLALLAHSKIKSSTAARHGSMTLAVLTIPLLYFGLTKGIFFSQTLLTLMTWLAVLLFLFVQPKQKWAWIALSVMSVLELGYNAYLSQVTLGYADADKFTSATLQMKELTDVVKNYNKAGFYRIGSSFIYSKNDPFIASYPGLSAFSSNLEKSTVSLFNSMGDVGGNASTYYANGTLLTDALYGVRYYMDRKDYTNEDVENNPTTHFFNRRNNRTDLKATYNLIYENDRFEIYENPNVFSIAYGTNPTTRNIKFGLNNPVSNQNIILASMSGVEQNYFEYVGIPTIELSNMEKVEENGNVIYRRIDKSQPGSVMVKFTPQTDYTYYFQAPYALRSSMGKISIIVNGAYYNYSQSYDQVQLWNLLDRSPGLETTITLQTSTEDEINLTNMGLVRANQTAIQEVLNQRLKQNMTVDSWTNTNITGSVDITDDSTVMMTSIPYDAGWSVTVDGQEVETTAAWDNSLLSFPITSGKHKIIIHYQTPGLWTGIIISVCSWVLIAYLIWLEKSKAQEDMKTART
ncbi:glycosyltransferase PgfM1 [Streptococcus caprae]